MAIIPCPVKVDCAEAITGGYPASPWEVDSPFANLSTEKPDTPIFFKRNYNFPQGPGVNTYGAQGCAGICWSNVSQAEADKCAAAMEVFCFIGPDICEGKDCLPLPKVFWNTAQICTRPCATAPGGVVSYTTPVERFYADTQEEANSKAFQHACEMASLQCAIPEWKPILNTEQSCTWTCPVGEPKTAIIPAGMFEGVDQLTANAIAQGYACLLAESFCTEDGFYFNEEQICTAKCADGTEFTFRVNAGVFQATSVAEANSQALAYACGQAQKHRMCMLDYVVRGCIGNVPVQIVEVAGGVAPITWAVVGALPPGFITVVNPANSRQIAITGGGSQAGNYDFQLKATDAGDYVIQKTLNYHVIDIENDEVLNIGQIGEEYSEKLDYIGTPSLPVSWQVVEGALPPGLILNEETGNISGIPEELGTFEFTISLQDEAT